MRVFRKEVSGIWGERLNFVDDNNVVLGYDYTASCCEKFYYYVTKEEPTSASEGALVDEDLVRDDGLYFDTTYYRQFETGEEGDQRNIAVFKVIGGVTELFIVLVNCHNGFYAHGFQLLDAKDDVLYTGRL